MTPEQQRKMLECAAKACGFKKWRVLTRGLFQVSNNENWNEAFAEWTGWNPLTNPADTAEMCAKLEIHIGWNTEDQEAVCIDLSGKHMIAASYADHDNSRLKTWMFAATMVAAKIGGYTE